MNGNPPTSLPSHQGLRQDWVSQTFKGENGVHGDADPFSYGCAIVFIYYLKSQLGYSMAQIVQAAGNTLEKRYQSLTGKTNGYAPFKALLHEYYPGSPPPVYDLFPVGGAACHVGLAASTLQDMPPTTLRTGVAFAGTMCGGGKFNYTLYNRHDHLHVVANVSGFAFPVVTWSVNGVGIAVNGSILPMSSTHTLSALVASADPSASSVPQLEQVKLEITVGSAPEHPDMTTFLDISVSGNPGQVQLRIDVTVHDANAPASDASATSFAIATLDTQELDWDPEYHRVQRECLSAWVKRHNRPLPWLIQYLPDPPLELLAAAHALDELAAEVHQIAKHDRALAEQLDRQFGGHLLSRARGNTKPE